MSQFEKQYLDIMKDILENGIRVPNRTGIDTLATWGQSMKFDLDDGFPIVTTRKTSLRVAFEETWFFLRGETDTKKLEEKKIKIWEGNTSREFLDKVGLSYLPVGHMGKGYSFQWRNFNGEYAETTFPYDPYHAETDYTKSVGGVDQVVNLLEGLKNDPHSRRHIISAWNPAQLHEMALPPCHLYQQYQILDDKLNSMCLLRSNDWVFGGPFNVMGYALLNCVFAKFLNLKPGTLQYVSNDAHIYENQIDIASQQIARIPFALPKLLIKKDFKTIDDIFSMKYSDIELIGYEAHPDFKDKPKMAV